MTDQTQFPPLHDPAPGEYARRKQHLLGEITREPKAPPPSLALLRRHRRLAISVALAVVVAVAVSVSVLTTGSSAPRTKGSQEAYLNPGDTLTPGDGSTDWAHPGGHDSQSVASVAEAKTEVAFQPVVPSDFGAPTALVLDPDTGGEGLTQADAQLTVAYDDASTGAFWLVERPAGSTTAQTLAGYAQECGSPGACYGTWTMESLASGVQGLAIEGLTGSTAAVVWVQNGVYFNVVGPLASFSPQQAASVANSVIEAAAHS